MKKYDELESLWEEAKLRYKQRILKAKERLSKMPATASTYQERTWLKYQRRFLIEEIEQINRLIGYTQQAREEME